MISTKQEMPLTTSRFYMWRAVFALAHADGVVTHEEAQFLSRHLARLPLTAEQREILTEDVREPQNPSLMFSRISNQVDRKDFFVHARLLVWCDNDYDAQEQKILGALQREYLNNLDDDELMLDITVSAKELEGMSALHAAQKSGLRGLLNLFKGA